MHLIEPGKLAEYFQSLLEVYEPSAEGKTLVELLKEDWQLFHFKLDVAHAKELVAEILDDGEVVRKGFIPSPAFKSEGLVQWGTLRDELMYRNRYFLDELMDVDRLRELLDHLPADDMPTKWFRARLSADGTAISLDCMGAPPKRLATNGRANPPGIPYLYLGSNAQTAIAEVRPHTGERACVATFDVQAPLKAVDLRNPRKVVSPFLLAGASAIGQLRADIPFLERLGEELTRPVLPQGAAIDYLPSQYLCEFIKKSGYEGVVYRSSVSDGINLALFNPDRGLAVDSALYDIKSVTVVVDRA